MQEKALVDSFGRVVKDLRISITDRCNFRCLYCMPAEGMQWVRREDVLTFEEIVRIARIGVERYGFDGIRLTGGEPTVRAQLPLLVEKLSSLRNPLTSKPVDIAMTTNGATLSTLAEDLKKAGLNRINISLDTLDRKKFAQVTRRDQLLKVIGGIQAAKAVGFDPVKLNVVVMRGINDDEILDFIEFGVDLGVTPRFIEFMPLDADDAWSENKVVPSDEIVDIIASKYSLTKINNGSDPASRYRLGDTNHEFGVIPTVTEPFCESCDRVRITAEGQFRTCLFAIEEYDLREIMRRGGSDDELAAEMERAVGLKWAGHQIGNVNFLRPNRSMSQIGG
ncbi:MULTISPECIES: GTP 3',8-cyclase MoaA [Acidithrix]|nr:MULTISPECIES: GTP 3',8-cyclase MoaA [Acidithrix]